MSTSKAMLLMPIPKPMTLVLPYTLRFQSSSMMLSCTTLTVSGTVSSTGFANIGIIGNISL
jgi:hypothetical protein